jgi:hypothetical protein
MDWPMRPFENTPRRLPSYIVNGKVFTTTVSKGRKGNAVQRGAKGRKGWKVAMSNYRANSSPACLA